MLYSRFFVAIVFLASLTTAGAQPAMQGPIPGLVFSSGSIRPLLGIPGSASPGPALLTGLRWASIAPGGHWALISRSGRPAAACHFSDAGCSESSPADLLAAIDSAVWSSDGAYALLRSSMSNQVQRLRFSESEASADAPVSLSGWGEVTAMAIDRSGDQMAIGVSGMNAGLYLLKPGQSPELLASMARPAAAAFDATGKALFAVDLEAQRILEFDSGAGPVEFAPLSSSDELTPDPVGLAVSGNGRYLLVADAANRAIRVYDRDLRSLANTLPLDFAPSRMDALSSGPTFLLNGSRANEWLMLLDAADIPRVYFVPAARTRNIKEAQ